MTRLRAAYPVLRRVSTRWGDEDVYGHVNNVVAYSLFDTAVNGWLIEASGHDVRNLDAIGLVVSSSCAYARPLSFPGDVEVGLLVDRLGRTSVTYELALFQGDDPAPAATGTFVHVYVDAATRRPVGVPDLLRDVLRLAVVAGDPSDG